MNQIRTGTSSSVAPGPQPFPRTTCAFQQREHLCLCPLAGKHEGQQRLHGKRGSEALDLDSNPGSFIG